MGSSNDPENHAIGGQLEHGWFNDFLMKVRLCITNPNNSVAFTDKAQVDFIKKWFIDYKNFAGEYMFQGGPYGNNVGEGSQFPSMSGSANSSFRSGASFPANAFQSSGNIFNSILRKLGDVINPPMSPVSSSPGGR